jgi:hypothetical protein
VGGTTTTSTAPSSGGSSASGTSSNDGGTPSTGGTSSTVGATSIGGASTTTGGISGNGGTAATGGTVAAGGNATGGSKANGGTSSAGGTKATGGTAAIGGTKATGGSTSVGGTSATGGSAACIAAGITKDTEATIATNGLQTVSYEGYLNGESFQEEGIISYKGYQYTAYWNSDKARKVVLARRTLSTVPTTPDGAWQTITFTDYAARDTNSDSANADAHNTISIGIAPGDGTLHLSFDHHGNDLSYRKSVVNLVSDPTGVAWSTASFGAVQSQLVSGTTIHEVTYPRFVTEPGGTKMLFSTRIGTSGAGDEYLWEYNTTSHAWTSLGMYLNGNLGSTSTANAYLHGLSYTKNGTRLHASWCWRETPDPYTNHDLFYVYSDDNGRTWKNTANALVGTTGSTYITQTMAEAKAYTIEQNRGLINQEHMAVDALGRVHVLLSHVPDGTITTAKNFTTQRTQTQYFHYMLGTDNKWSVRSIAATPVQRNFRGKLAISTTNNVYAILPSPLTTTSSIYDAQMVIAGASPCNNFTWTVLTTDSSRSYFSDPLVDASRLLDGNELTIVNQQQTSGNIWGLEYTLK